jgi:UDP-2-acetamido-3-amino-2,3-dideoxy-glucuronate N-acetyltransferase
MEGVFVHPTATVEKGASLGKGCKIWHYAHVREGAILGKNCNAGHCAYIDADVIVGDNVKIGNKASIFRGVEIESDAFIGPHVAFTNDKRPRSLGEWKLVKTLVRRGASIGTNSTVICGVTIGENSMVGAGSVVTKDVPANGLVYGNPAKLKGFICICKGECKKKSEKGLRIVLRCRDCGREFEVEKSVYKLLERG